MNSPIISPTGGVRHLSGISGHVLVGSWSYEMANPNNQERTAMDLEFFEPAEAAALMRCSEGWLRDGAAAGRFPHACWGKGKIVFTSEHIAEIARLSEILPDSLATSAPARGTTSARLIGTRARNHPVS